MMKIINRDTYIAQVSPYIGQNLIKVLTGQRRSGKTYLMLQIAELIRNSEKKAHIIFINKEEYEFKDITNNEHLYEYVIKNSVKTKNNFVFIDEVQEIEKFEIALRQLLIKNYDIYCTGSNAHILSSELATHLSGRYIEIPVFGLSFSEFLKFHSLEKTKETLLKYIKYGGLPYLIHLEQTDEIVYGYLKNIYNSIILKDVVSRYNIRDINFLERLVEYLHGCMGSYVSSKKITDFLKSQRVSLSNNTVLNYLDYLANSFFIDKVQRYDIQGKKIFEINDKYYFRDLGIIHSLIPYKPGDIGKILENLVYNQLQFEGYKVNVGKMGDMEIDFVARKTNETKYIQVVYQMGSEKVLKREFENLLSIKDNYPKLVISADEFNVGNYKGIEHKNILDFLVGE